MELHDVFIVGKSNTADSAMLPLVDHEGDRVTGTLLPLRFTLWSEAVRLGGIHLAIPYDAVKGAMGVVSGVRPRDPDALGLFPRCACLALYLP